MSISIVILSYNSEATIGNTIEAAGRVSTDIHVVDSFSSDSTEAIVKRHGAHFVSHEFKNYSIQRNWAIKHLPLAHDWELHLDADEILSEELIKELHSVSNISSAVVGYFIARMVRFMGRPIRHGGMFPIWHMRCFRRGQGRCEDREYDQHFVVSGITSKLRGTLIDDIRMPLTEWISRHNRWSDAEVSEWSRGRREGEVVPRISGNPVERKRYLRSKYMHLPLFSRALCLFGYRYLFRLGFLDGKEGLIFFSLQTLWFRFLVDAKIHEQSRTKHFQSAHPAVLSDN